MDISDNHKNFINELSDSNKQYFNKWLYLLHENFNILLYGLGSKRLLLKRFQHFRLSNVPVIVVNGFFPTLSIKDILDGILQGILDLKEYPLNIFEACEVIEHEFAHRPELHLYLIIHNIEGDILANFRSLGALSRIAAVNNIHLITSIDHINAPLSKFFSINLFLSYSTFNNYSRNSSSIY